MSSLELPDIQFEALVDYLRLSRGFDFTGYKRSSLVRPGVVLMTEAEQDRQAL